MISSPDSYRGETVKAFVAVHEAARSTIRAEDVRTSCPGFSPQTEMASYKAPRSVIFVDSLPRTESNKISWRLLQEAEWKR